MEDSLTPCRLTVSVIMESRKVPSASRSLAHSKPVTFSGARMIRPPRDAYGETEACVVCPYTCASPPVISSRVRTWTTSRDPEGGSPLPSPFPPPKRRVLSSASLDLGKASHA